MDVIKPDAYEIHFSRFKEEEELARAFGEGFIVSSGRKFDLFSLWYLEPVNQVKERFGIDKEILVLYSAFPKTDARFLAAVNRICQSNEFRERAERLIVFLVHKGGSDDVSAVIRQHMDRTIVQFQADELLNPAKNAFFIRQRLADVLGKEDLFGMSSPLT